MCGDSTHLEYVERLVDNQSVDMVWTDPPCNVDYEGKTKESLKIDNGSMGDSKFRQFLRDLFISAFTVTKEGGPIYVAHADTEGVNFRLALQEAGFYLKQVLIRVKSSSVMGRQDYPTTGSTSPSCMAGNPEPLTSGMASVIRRL